MSDVFKPKTTAELTALVLDANAQGRRLEPRGGGTKAAFGGWVGGGDLVDMSAFSGVIDYDPAELVLTAKAGTPVAQIEALLAERGQMLAFEPMDHAAVLGGAPGDATLGGLVGANSSGPRRLSAGALRDHLLGFQAVTGGGDGFKAGAKVVKNVTGFDLSKLMAGSWGSLAILTEMTFKVLPAPRETRTLILHGLAPDHAVAIMGQAMRSPAEVSGAAHLARGPKGGPATLLRLEGFGPSVAARVRMLASMFGSTEEIGADASALLWRSVRDAEAMAGPDTLWRVTLPPIAGARFIAAMAGGRWLIDWAGGLVWWAGEGPVHATAALLGGSAVLVRGTGRARALEPKALAQLSARVKLAFDPNGVLADRLRPQEDR